MIKMSQQLLHFLEFLLHIIIALIIFSVRIKLLAVENGFFVSSTQKLYHKLVSTMVSQKLLHGK